MALTDDLTSIVIIAIAVLVVTILVTTRVVTQARAGSGLKDAQFRQDYYGTAVDTFLRLQDNSTRTPYNVLLGEYVHTGRPLIITPNGTVDVRNTSQDALDRIFGRDNYYFQVNPTITDVRISFVLDGTDSMKAERQTMAANMRSFRDNVTALFATPGTTVNITVYILSGSDESTMCSQFTTQGFACRRIGFEELYNNTRYVTVKPVPQYFVANTYAQQDPKVFYEADWVAGTNYAAERYVDYIRSKGTVSGKLHIIIPLANKLSTSSIADSCFMIPQNDPHFWDNYVACALCDSTCPAGRSAVYIQNVSRFINETNTLVIPVFSSRCSFTYNPRWSTVASTAYNRQWLTPPVTGSLCTQSACGGCEPGPDPANLSGFCFHDNCHAELLSQMNTFAANTGGQVVNIADVDQLSQQVTDNVNTAVTSLTLELGVRNDTRTHYVIERNILLPTQTGMPIRIWAYDPPYKTN